jgi:predicted RNA polymerase sigma factor
VPELDGLTSEPSLKAYHLLPAVRGDFLVKLGRFDEAATELARAASLTRNVPERNLLLERARSASSQSTVSGHVTIQTHRVRRMTP